MALSEGYVCTSKYMSRKQLKAMANFVRRYMNYQPLQKFDPLYAVESFIPQKLDSEYQFVCTSQREWPHKRSQLAVCDFKNHYIEVREDVYNGARNGNPRDIFTLCHEFCHYVLFLFFGCPVVYRDIDIPKTQRSSVQTNPEWQANTLTGFLCLTDEMVALQDFDTILQVSGLSRSALKYSLDLRKRDDYYKFRKARNKAAKAAKEANMKNRKKSFC